MVSSAAPANIYQVGTQSVLATPVAATAKLAVPSMEFEATDDINRPQLIGAMLRAPGNEFVQARGTTWRVPAHPACFEQLPGWLNAAIDGGVEGVGAEAPYTWTFTRDPFGMPALDPLTLQRRLTNFTNHIDERFPKAVPTRITLSGQRNGEVQLAVEGFAGRRESSAITSALTMPVPTHIPFALSRMWIDSAWASLGTTQITGQVLSWSWSFMTGAVGIPTADGNANLDYDVLRIDGRNVGVEFRARLLQDKTRYEAERTAAEATGLRAIRLGMTGPGSRAITIDSLLKYERGSMTQVDEEDGQVVYDLTLQESTDGDEFCEVVVATANDDQWGIAS